MCGCLSCTVHLVENLIFCIVIFESNSLVKHSNINLDVVSNLCCYLLQIVATLVTWTKGFSAQGVVGEDVSLLLKDACDRKVSTVVMYSIHSSSDNILG